MLKANAVDIEPKENKDYAAIEINRWSKLIKKHEQCGKRVKRYKVKKVTDVDRILHKANLENAVHYSTVRKRGEESVKSKEIPEAFVTPGGDDFDVDFAEIKIRRDNITDLLDKDLNYATDREGRICVSKGSREHLKGITDVDEKYFLIVKEKQFKFKLKMGSYLNYLKESLRLRLQTGYVLDEVLKLNEQSEVEKHKMLQIKAKLKTYSTSFKAFLDEDHEESIKPTLHYLDEVYETDKRRKILKRKNTEVVKLRYEIYELEEAWRKCQLCEKFVLSFFSILTSNNSTFYYDLKYGRTNDENIISDIEIKKNDESLASLINFETPKVINNDAFELNLSNPSYLLEVFRSLEHQCLDYLTFNELLEKPNKSISNHLRAITDIYEIEINSVRQSVSKLQSLINFIESNNSSLKSRVNELLYGLFKDTFSGAEESIILNEYIKQTYLMCVSGSDAASPSLQMMRQLGSEYQRILLEMDSLPTGYLKEFVKDVKNRKSAKLAIARNTRRQLRELENTNQQMSRIFRPTLVKKHSRKLIYRSYPRTKKDPIPPKPKEITEDEKEYLYLFTDFCKYADNANDYLSKMQDN